LEETRELCSFIEKKTSDPLDWHALYNFLSRPGALMA
jgi:hypothetical protein